MLELTGAAAIALAGGLTFVAYHNHAGYMRAFYVISAILIIASASAALWSAALSTALDELMAFIPAGKRTAAAGAISALKIGIAPATIGLIFAAYINILAWLPNILGSDKTRP